jgi:hypothetical protein
VLRNSEAEVGDCAEAGTFLPAGKSATLCADMQALVAENGMLAGVLGDFAKVERIAHL